MFGYFFSGADFVKNPILIYRMAFSACFMELSIQYQKMKNEWLFQCHQFIFKQSIILILLLKPLLYQGGVLMAPSRHSKNVERRDKRGTNATNDIATRWHRQRTSWKLLERKGSVFLLDMFKTNAVVRRSNKNTMWTSCRQRCNVVRASSTPPGAPLARGEIVVVGHGVCTKIL